MVPSWEAVVRVDKVQSRLVVTKQGLLPLLSTELHGVGVHLLDVPLDGAHLECGQTCATHHADQPVPAAVIVHQVIHTPACLVIPPLVLARVMSVPTNWPVLERTPWEAAVICVWRPRSGLALLCSSCWRSSFCREGVQAIIKVFETASGPLGQVADSLAPTFFYWGGWRLGPGRHQCLPLMAAQVGRLRVAVLDVAAEAADTRGGKRLRTHHADHASAVGPVGHQVVHTPDPCGAVLPDSGPRPEARAAPSRGLGLPQSLVAILPKPPATSRDTCHISGKYRVAVVIVVLLSRRVQFVRAVVPQGVRLLTQDRERRRALGWGMLHSLEIWGNKHQTNKLDIKDPEIFLIQKNPRQEKCLYCHCTGSKYKKMQSSASSRLPVRHTDMWDQCLGSEFGGQLFIQHPGSNWD